MEGPIGMFDSGFGGLTVARATIDLLPGEDLVYVGDTGRYPYGSKPLELCREVFLGERTPESDEKLMMASFFGGMSIAYSQVGVAHATSYGLSYVLGLKHGEGNCVAFNHLEEFYPEGVAEFHRMADFAGVDLPTGVTAQLPDSDMERMMDVSLGMGPLWENALGPDWRHRIPT